MEQREFPVVTCPFIIFWGDTVGEELRLIRLGWPLEDAITFCYTKRKEGGLEEFIEALEDETRDRARYDLVCRQAAREAID